MRDENERGQSICGQALDAEVLADYWLGALAGPEEEAAELHLLECDRCGDRLRDVIAIAEGLRAVANQGALRVVVTDTFIRRAREKGLRVREYAPAAGGSVACTATDEDDILIARLAADLSGARRVDLQVCDENGHERARLQDIPVCGDDVTFQESIAWAKAAPTSTLVMRLIAVDDAEGDRLLGEYTFNHTRTLPGSGRVIGPGV